jgi:hypothetical protein
MQKHTHHPKNAEVRYNVAVARRLGADLEIQVLATRIVQRKADYAVSKGKFKELLGKVIKELEHDLKEAQQTHKEAKEEEAQALQAFGNIPVLTHVYKGGRGKVLPSVD